MKRANPHLLQHTKCTTHSCLWHTSRQSQAKYQYRYAFGTHFLYLICIKINHPWYFIVPLLFTAFVLVHGNELWKPCEGLLLFWHIWRRGRGQLKNSAHFHLQFLLRTGNCFPYQICDLTRILNYVSSSMFPGWIKIPKEKPFWLPIVFFFTACYICILESSHQQLILDKCVMSCSNDQIYFISFWITYH